MAAAAGGGAGGGGLPSAGGLLDTPLFSSVAFHPRKAQQGSSGYALAQDGTVEVHTDAGGQPVHLGYRFFPLEERAGGKEGERTPVLVHFHGNAEIAADYDHAVSAMRAIGVHLLCFDFRGYGWSSDVEPRLSRLQPDAERVAEQLPTLLQELGCDPDTTPVLLFGRSLGSTCAVHMAHRFPDRFRAVIIESGITIITELPMVHQLSAMVPGGDQILASVPDIFEHCRKLRDCLVPLLVLHGEDDEIAPVKQGQDMYEASGAELKRIKRFRGAGHNDLLLVHGRAYYAYMEHFINSALGRPMARDLQAQIEEADKADAAAAANAPTGTTSKLEQAKTQAETLIQEQRYEDALPLLTQALRSAPLEMEEFRLELCHLRALCYFRVGRLSACQEDCSNALAFDRDNASILTLRAKSYMRDNQEAFALEDARRAVEVLCRTNTSLGESAAQALVMASIAAE